MTVPLVSVLLTAFNRESYLAASIESVLAQTWGDFELIVVDDRSTDGTIDIARRYERLDSRVRVVEGQISATFAVKTSSVTASRQANILGTVGNCGSASASMTVNAQ